MFLNKPLKSQINGRIPLSESLLQLIHFANRSLVFLFMLLGTGIIQIIHIVFFPGEKNA